MDCCAACETVCPVNAIFFEEDVPAEWAGYIAKNRQWFQTHETSGTFRPRIEHS